MTHISFSSNSLSTGSKIADKVTLFALEGCLQCTYLYPLFKLSAHLVADLKIKVFSDKEVYHKEAVSLLKELKIKIPSQLPVPLIYIKIGSLGKLVDQSVIDECAFAIKDSMTDDELFEYLDLEFKDNSMVIRLMSKIIAETLF